MSRREGAGLGGVARSLSNVPLPPPVMTTTSPFAEKMSFGLIGVETSMVMKVGENGRKMQKSDFNRVKDGLCYSDMEHNDCVTDGNKPLAKSIPRHAAR